MTNIGPDWSISPVGSTPRSPIEHRRVTLIAPLNHRDDPCPSPAVLPSRLARCLSLQVMQDKKSSHLMGACHTATLRFPKPKAGVALLSCFVRLSRFLIPDYAGVLDGWLLVAADS